MARSSQPIVGRAPKHSPSQSQSTRSVDVACPTVALVCRRPDPRAPRAGLEHEQVIELPVVDDPGVPEQRVGQAQHGGILAGRRQPTGATSLVSRSARVRSGSVVTPACTGEGWTTVLRGAVSMPNRVARPSFSGRADRGGGRPGRRPRPSRGPRRCRPRRRARGAGRRRPPRRRAESPVLAVEDHADVDELAALDPRDRPQHRVLEGVAGRRHRIGAHCSQRSAAASRVSR